MGTGTCKRRLLMTLLVSVYFPVMVIVHELGHIAAIRLVSDANVRVSVWPGYELYPMPGEKYRGIWPERSVAIVQPYWILAAPGEVLPSAVFIALGRDRAQTLHEYSGFLKFMGAGATSLLSLFCLILLSARQYRPGLSALLSAGALLHVDMLTFAVFPLFFDAPHLYFIGGSTPEPLIGLVEMGLSQNFALGLTVLGSAVQFGWLYWLRTRGWDRQEETTRDSGLRRNDGGSNDAGFPHSRE